MKKTAPSQGEDNALQGFTSQYKAASELIINAIQKENFEFVILKDFKAGQVDDVQIVTTNRVYAYQIKWHDPIQSLTLGELKGSDSNPQNGLLHQLANGWELLKKENHDKEVFVCLYTNSRASTSEIGDIKKTHGGPRHLAEFIKTYWGEKAIDSNTEEKWNPLIQKLKKISKVLKTEFDVFKEHCIFALNRRLPSEREEYQPQKSYYKDIDHLQSILIDHAGKIRGKIILTKKDIISLANWGNRFEFRSRHEFPTIDYYTPIEQTVRNFNNALKKINQGYIALIGSPGSGKSTLLTNTLRYRNKINLIRYYCFVPDDSALSRGEAYNFLHDLNLALWNAGIRPSSHSLGESLEHSRKMLEAQLEEINILWNEKSIQTIILVDGLDHIKRESNPERSLIYELPIPSAIPKGCLFVLGSQQIENIDLNIRILNQLKSSNSERIVKIDHLSRREMRKIIFHKGMEKQLSAENLEKIESLSKGHPLSLNYILNRLDVGCLNALVQFAHDLVP